MAVITPAPRIGKYAGKSEMPPVSPAKRGASALSGKSGKPAKKAKSTGGLMKNGGF